VIRTGSITAEIRGKKKCFIVEKDKLYVFTVEKPRLRNMLQDFLYKLALK